MQRLGFPGLLENRLIKRVPQILPARLALRDAHLIAYSSTISILLLLLFIYELSSLPPSRSNCSEHQDCTGRRMRPNGATRDDVYKPWGRSKPFQETVSDMEQKRYEQRETPRRWWIVTIQVSINIVVS